MKCWAGRVAPSVIISFLFLQNKRQKMNIKKMQKMNQWTQDNYWCLVKEHSWVTVARPRRSLLDILFEQILLSVRSHVSCG